VITHHDDLINIQNTQNKLLFFCKHCFFNTCIYIYIRLLVMAKTIYVLEWSVWDVINVWLCYVIQFGGLRMRSIRTQEKNTNRQQVLNETQCMCDCKSRKQRYSMYAEDCILLCIAYKGPTLLLERLTQLYVVETPREIHILLEQHTTIPVFWNKKQV